MIDPRLHPIRRTAVALAVAACFSTSLALANPTNPTVVNGTATFATAGNILNITNGHNAIINWGSFSIGLNELTRFIQPSALSAVLNRVIGQDPSAILGALQSNGRVFLINPNGIVFGAGAQIDVAGLVASTLNLSNEDFLANRLRFTDGALAGNVVNQGSITGGSVYLVGKATTNEGLITSPNGEVVLAAGNSVELVNPGTPNLRVEIVAPDNEARNLGTIAAEAGRIGIYAGLIKQGGVISADSAVAEGGRIVLKSTKSTVLEAGSVTSARGTSGGEIIALSSMTDGVTHVAGTLDASAIASGNPGSGGFIETSAAKVKVADNALVSTKGSGGGRTGTWLIDPNDFKIGDTAYGGDIAGSTLGSNLESSSVVITSDQGATAGNGDIFVNDSVSWVAPNSLTLLARRNVEVNNSIDGGGDLVFMAGWDGASTTTPVVTSGVGDISSNYAGILTRGNIHFEAGQDILLGATTVQAGKNLLGLAGDGLAKSVKLIAGRNIELTAPDGGTAVLAFGNEGSSASVILQAKTGSILVQGSEIQARGGDGSESAGGDATVTLCTGALAGGVCTPSAAGGITVSNSAIGAIGGSGSSGQRGGDATVRLTAGSGGIQVSGYGFVNGSSTYRGIYAFGGSGDNDSVGGRGGDAAVTLSTSGHLTLMTDNSTSIVEASGGQGGDSSNGTGGRGGDATVTLSAGGDLAIGNSSYGGSIRAYAGDGGSGSDGDGGRGGDAMATLSAGGNLTMGAYGGRIDVEGGDGGWVESGAAFDGGAGGNAKIKLTAGGGIAVTANSWVSAIGGSGDSAGSNGVGGRGGNAEVELISAGSMTISGYVRAYGGYATDGGDGGAASIRLTDTSSAGILIDGGEVYASGGGAGSFYGGTGGNGGAAEVVLASSGGITVDSWVEAQGGYGGYAYSGGTQGNGGTANVTLTNTSTSSPLVVDGSVYADGGEGAVGGGSSIVLNSAGGVTVGGYVRSYAGYGYAGSGGFAYGGNASVAINNTSAAVPISITGDVDAEGGDVGSSLAGTGGNAEVVMNSAGGIMVNSGWVTADAGYGANGGDGGAASIRLTDTSAAGILIDGGEVYASGGGAGYVYVGTGGNGGAAEVVLTSAGGITVDSWVEAQGGSGGYAYSGGTQGNGGAAVVTFTNTSTTNPILINGGVNADGGNGKMGGNALVILSSAGDINVGGEVAASGGYGNSSGQGGAAAVTMLAGGNIQIEGGEGAAWGGGGATGGNAAVNVIAGGAITVSNNGGGGSSCSGECYYYGTDNLIAYAGYGTTPGVSSVVLASAGNLALIDGAGIYSDGVVGLGGANILVDNAFAFGGGGASVSATGNVDVLNNGSIVGNPDVFMTVGGVVNMGNGGVISAGEPTTIYLTFPMLESGGYFVNGIEGVVFDGNTGFFAGGAGAILGTNLLVTYGGEPVLNIPTDTLLVAMGKSIEPPEPEKDKDIFAETEDEKKKNAPVCR